jgi:hypothetical protein
MALEEYSFWLEVATFLVEAAIVILLYRTVKDYAEVAKVSKIEAKQRFRPWVGPEGGISFLREENGKRQYSITIKNFGEIPAANVVGMSAARMDLPARSTVNKDQLDQFSLGPLLPSMEKRYWIFIDSSVLEKAKNENNSIYTIVYFLYEFAAGAKSGYGMISQLDPRSNTFVHKDMWVDQEISSFGEAQKPRPNN